MPLYHAVATRCHGRHPAQLAREQTARCQTAGHAGQRRGDKSINTERGRGGDVFGTVVYVADAIGRHGQASQRQLVEMRRRLLDADLTGKRAAGPVDPRRQGRATAAACSGSVLDQAIAGCARRASNVGAPGRSAMIESQQRRSAATAVAVGATDRWFSTASRNAPPSSCPRSACCSNQCQKSRSRWPRRGAKVCAAATKYRSTSMS